MPQLIAPVVGPDVSRRHPQPTLVIDGGLIRPWRDSDAPDVAAAYRDHEIQRWHLRTMTEGEALDWVRSWSRQWSAQTGAGWAVSNGPTLLGRVGFRDLDAHEGSGEVAYWTLPAARGRGIAARALTAVTGWMFEQAGWHRMVLHHSVHNPASCRVADKAGYGYEGTAREQVRHLDGWHDMHVHARIAG